MAASFNPTLVRLRPVAFLLLSAALWICFNPTLVRLRRTRPGGPPRWAPVAARFNPTLVRLRRICNRERDEDPTRVSIPRWFD